MKQEKLKTKKTGVETPKLKSFVPMPPIKPAKEDAHPRYIDAGKLEAELLRKIAEANEAKMCLTENDFADLIHDAETADVAPIVHAHWKRLWTKMFECSRCKRAECLEGLRSLTIDEEKSYMLELYPYCHCGAKMDEEAK